MNSQRRVEHFKSIVHYVIQGLHVNWYKGIKINQIASSFETFELSALDGAEQSMQVVDNELYSIFK